VLASTSIPQYLGEKAKSLKKKLTSAARIIAPPLVIIKRNKSGSAEASCLQMDARMRLKSYESYSNNFSASFASQLKYHKTAALANILCIALKSDTL
jgi:hypothetical protein